MLSVACACAALLWLAVIALPWRPWAITETIEADRRSARALRSITALIPARNEAHHIVHTLRALTRQGELARIVLVDDESADDTRQVAAGCHLTNLKIVAGGELPSGWSGKMWALEQGLSHVETEHLLLLDADIVLDAGTVATLLDKLEDEHRDLVSVMAKLPLQSIWERLLLPPFIYFFKLLYPFALANRAGSRVAAAAGGCILVKTKTLRAVGGFKALKDALIDDCTLAKKVKDAGGATWIGLSHNVRANRTYTAVADIWNMVARTAFTQLRYSGTLLMCCSALLALNFIVPILGLGAEHGWARACAGAALLLMSVSYLPVVRYYDLPHFWVVSLPLAAVLYLLMTWTSAWRFYRGERSRWKGRVYSRKKPISH